VVLVGLRPNDLPGPLTTNILHPRIYGIPQSLLPHAVVQDIQKLKIFRKPSDVSTEYRPGAVCVGLSGAE